MAEYCAANGKKVIHEEIRRGLDAVANKITDDVF